MSASRRIMCLAVPGWAWIMALPAGCGTAPPSNGNGTSRVFAAFNDAGGTYRVWNDEQGRLSHYEILVSSTSRPAVVRFPDADEPEFIVDLQDGGELTVTDAAGLAALTLRDTALQSIIEDNVLELRVTSGPEGSTTHSLFDFYLLLIDPETPSSDECTSNRSIVDTYCTLIVLLDLETLVTPLQDHVGGSEEQALDLLSDYLAPLSDFCDSWQSYRTGVDPCDGS